MVAIAVLVVYIILMLGLGYWGMRQTKGVNDFFLGGRSIGPWMSAFAYGTTYFSAVLFVGYAGKLGWGFGHYTLWIVLGNTLVGSFLAWVCLARRTRRMTAELGAMTMPEFLEARFGSRFLRIAAALIIFVFLVPYSGSVYMGLSYLIEISMGVPYVWALTLLAVLTAVYLIMGGYFALTLTDFLRGIVEVFGAIVMVIVLVTGRGGLATVWTSLNALSFPGFGPVNMASSLPGIPAFVGPGWIVLASLVLITSLGPWGMPQMVQKFYSLKSEDDVRRATIIATVFALIISAAAYFSGSLSHLYYTALPIDPATNKASVDYLMPKLMTDFVPSGISLVIILLVFSASMSSLSSLVLVSSSSVAIDLYKREVRPEPTNAQVMLLLRVLCGVFVLCSLGIALLRPAFILSLMAISWGAIGGSFIGPYVYGLFWKGTTKAGAIAGLLSGLIICLTLYVAWGEPGVPIAGALAIIIPIFLTPAVSLATRRSAAAKEPAHALVN